MVVTYYIKLFRAEADRHNCILMFLFILVAQTTSTSSITLREKCPNTEFLLFLRMMWISVFSPNTGKYGLEKIPYLGNLPTALIDKPLK